MKTKKPRKSDQTPYHRSHDDVDLEDEHEITKMSLSMTSDEE